MSTLENRLRDAFRADAHTVRPDSLPEFAGVPARPVTRRARLLIPVAAAMAVAVIAAGVWGSSSVLRGRAQRSGGPTAGSLPVPVLGDDGHQAPPAVRPAGSAAGAPRFFVTDEPADVPDANDLVVRDTVSGRIVGIVAPPTGKFFGSVAATADDRTFVAAVMPTNGPPCVNHLYQFQLDNSGQPGALVALHVAVPGNFNEDDTLAITPDGRIIAYATYLCGQLRQEYGVIDLATRQVRVWTTGRGIGPAWFPVDLSLSADGRLLVYAEEGGPARILRTAAAAGSILARSRILSRDSYWVALAADGSAFYGCTISAPGPTSQLGSLTYFSQAIGSAQRHVIASWPNVRTPQCAASLDPSGRYLLMQFPTANDYVRPVILDLQTGRTTSIRAPAYYGPITVTW